MDRDHIVPGWRCISTNSYAVRKLDKGLVIALAAATRAHYIIIAHNNPHSDLINTKRDNALHKRVQKLCRHLDCHLQDQLIIGTQGYYSFVEDIAVYL